MARSENPWTAVCVGLLAVVTTVDALMGGGLEAVLVAGPVVASTQLSPRRTAIMAGLALARALPWPPSMAGSANSTSPCA